MRYVLPDDVVAGLATIKPVKSDDFAQLRRFDAGMKRQLGPAILEAVARGQALSEDELPQRPTRSAAPSRDALVSLLGAAIAEIARAAELPASLLVPRAALERLAREIPARSGELRTRVGTCSRGAWRSSPTRSGGCSRGEAKLTIEGYARGDPKVRLIDESTPNSFKALDTLRAGDRSYSYFRLDALERAGIGKLARLPFSLKILLENLLRCEDGRTVTREHIEALARYDGHSRREREIAFTPARVLLQDFTGVPCVVDLAAMRDAMAQMGGEARAINPLQPVELVIDHSVQVDYFGSAGSLAKNTDLEFERNQERYAFLKWGQSALRGFRVVPPGTGIVHQVNIEYLARVVFGADDESQASVLAYPDTAVGTDSHTTMVNGLGVLAWGVGGIEAEAAMLDQPVTMLIPEVIGFRLDGALREGVTATDLVLTVAQLLRRKGVVGKFVEFYGAGLSALPVVDRTTISNMSPEFGSTVAIFPIDERTLEYLRFTGRSPQQVELVETYAKAQSLFRTDQTPDPEFADTLMLDLTSVEPSLAGPRRPQDRVALHEAKHSFSQAMKEWTAARERNGGAVARFEDEGGGGTATIATTAAEVADGAVVIAAITSCTNTSNPSVLIGAGLLARNAVERGLRTQPWVKTSLAPGSKVVTDYLERAGLREYLDRLGFNLVGYGCTTCIGNSGPLSSDVGEAIADRDLIVAAVLSGNRNFEGRIHPQVRANYLASPPLVVAYALAGRMDVDLTTEPLGSGSDGRPVYLKDIWPSNDEINATMARAIGEEMFAHEYSRVFDGDENWRNLPSASGERYNWDPPLGVREAAAVLRRHAGGAGAAARRARCTRDCGARRLGDHRSHFAGRKHLEE